MITKELIATYQEIDQSFYYNVEYYFAQSLKEILPNNLSVRDSFVIVAIYQLAAKKINYSSMIAKEIGMSASAFSNHLRVIERSGIVERHRDTSNRKRIYIVLTPYGEEIYTALIHHIESLFRFVLNNLSLTTKIGLASATQKFILHIRPESKGKINLLTTKNRMELITNSIRDMYLYFSNQEQSVFEQQSPALSLRESRFLTVIYLFSFEGRNYSKEIADHLGFAMSTNTSLIKVLSEKGLVVQTANAEDRRRLDIQVTKQAIPLIQAHMNNRVAIHRSVQQVLSKSDMANVAKAFGLIKKFVLHAK
jgi:DNA-binding MarR family transcriptional regulator